MKRGTWSTAFMYSLHCVRTIKAKKKIVKKEEEETELDGGRFSLRPEGALKHRELRLFLTESEA